jgi:hypothetical protein
MADDFRFFRGVAFSAKGANGFERFTIFKPALPEVSVSMEHALRTNVIYFLQLKPEAPAQKPERRTFGADYTHNPIRAFGPKN